MEYLSAMKATRVVRRGKGDEKIDHLSVRNHEPAWRWAENDQKLDSIRLTRFIFRNELLYQSQLKPLKGLVTKRGQNGIQVVRGWLVAWQSEYSSYLQLIMAEGEVKSSTALRRAADVIAESPAAMQLRYLQTLNVISAEKNSTIVFPLPTDFLAQLTSK